MRRRRLVALLCAVGAALGIAAEALSFSGLDGAIADLATGWVLVGCGAWGIDRRPGEPAWPLLAVAGAAWFVPNLAGGVPGALSSLAAALLYLHRGPLVHAVAGDAARAGSVAAIAAIAAGYADAVGIGGGALTLAVAVLLAGTAGRSAVVRARGVSRARPIVPAAALALAAGLALAGAVSLSGAAVTWADYAYDAAIGAGALLLVSASVLRDRTLATVADLVVELGPARRSGAARDALARALGDPALEVGYWLGDAGVYVDEIGREIALPPPGSGRSVTVIERDGERLAALVHAPAAIDDPALAGAAADAAVVVLANVRLRAAAEHQVAELDASRRRLVAARDEQRRRLERRLHDGAQRHLREVAAALRDVRAQAPAHAEDDGLLDLLDGELSQAQHEVVELARGIHPRILSERGLPAALESLADRAVVAVELTVPRERLPAPVEAAAYFVCSEALANTGKYARATRARCEVARRDGAVTVRVTDDGVGGADPARGSGLRGLADRVEALGGTLHVKSPPSGGTAITAELPVDVPAAQGAP
jgi:signal transduction histidine kinase